jgi:hypothetical protein
MIYLQRLVDVNLPMLYFTSEKDTIVLIEKLKQYETNLIYTK